MRFYYKISFSFCMVSRVSGKPKKNKNWKRGFPYEL